MNKSALLASLALALVLGVAALLLLKPPAPAPLNSGAATPPRTGEDAPPRSITPGGLLDFDPARVSEITITRAPRRSSPSAPLVAPPPERITRAADGSWRLMLPNPDSAGEMRAWPLTPVRVRAALRILTEARGEPARDAADLPEPVATLTVTLDDRSTRTLSFTDRRLAGRVLAAAQSGPVLIDESLFDAFVTTGSRAWREPGVLAVMLSQSGSQAAGDISRLSLKTPTGQVTIGRVKGRWGLQSPIAAPADDQAVGALVSALGSAAIVRYLDDTDTSTLAPHLTPPVAELLIESDRREVRGVDVLRSTVARTLVIGGPADIAEKTLFAVIRGSPGEPDLPVTLDRAALDRISAAPWAYIARTATAVPAPDIGIIIVKPAPRLAADRSRWPELPSGEPGRAFARTDTGAWTVVPGAGETIPIAAIGRAEPLVDLLTAVRAEFVFPGGAADPEAQGDTIATIELFTPGMEPLDRLEFRAVPLKPQSSGGPAIVPGTATGSGKQLVVITRSAALRYSSADAWPAMRDVFGW